MVLGVTKQVNSFSDIASALINLSSPLSLFFRFSSSATESDLNALSSTDGEGEYIIFLSGY